MIMVGIIIFGGHKIARAGWECSDSYYDDDGNFIEGGCYYIDDSYYSCIGNYGCKNVANPNDPWYCFGQNCIKGGKVYQGDSTCKNECTAVQHYSCSTIGAVRNACGGDDNGPFISSSCDNTCRPTGVIWVSPPGQTPGPTPKPPVTASISCNGAPSTTIPYNSSANVTWSSSNALGCTVLPTGWIGTSGSRSTGPLYSAQTYSLTCNQ